MTEEKLARKANAAFFNPTAPVYSQQIGTWSTTKVDKMSFDDHKTYADAIKSCRFYFRHEPIVWSVISKMTDLAINDLVVTTEGAATKTEKQIFEALSRDLVQFFRNCALEYLTTGLVVPEITFTRITQREVRDKGIQRLSSLMYPTDMWLRDAKDIEIKKPFITSKESYFLIIPDDVVYFITTGGEYPDGSEDTELYKEIVRLYPDLVRKIKAGETKILLDNPLIIKSTELTDSQYPIPYLYAGLESYKHKRNLKRMDYSIAARVISAILHVKAGTDDYPLTEDQEEFLDDLEAKFKWRDGFSGEDIERVFTLFTNHTVNMEWIFPEIDALLSEKKYDGVNEDIIFSLGFPRILITGETEKSFASDPEIATLSPLNTLEVMREDLLPIARKVFQTMRDEVPVITSLPSVEFRPINLMSLGLFYQGLTELYASGNLSRQSYAEAYGYDLRTEFEKRGNEKELLDELGLEEFAPVPHSNEPNTGGQTKKTTTKTTNTGTK